MITPRYGFGIWLLSETPFAELDDILPDGTENTSGLCLNDNWRGIDTQLWNIHEGLGMNLQSVKPFTEDYGLWVFDDTGETKKALMLEGIDEVRLIVSSNILATQAYVQQFAQGVDWQKSVLDKDLTAPPGSPTTGDRYIVAIGATGDWAGHDDDIVEWNGTAWEFTTPNESFACGVEDEDTFYIYNDTAWVKMAGIFNHNDLANLQGGQAGEYWHLETAQHTALINFSDNANQQLEQLNSGGSPTFVGGHFTGKLTVDGLIDPTGLVLDPQATTPFTTEKGIWLNNANVLNFIFDGLSLYDDKPFYFDEAQEKYLKLNSTLGRFEFNETLYAPFYYGDGSNITNIGIGTPVRVSLTVQNDSGATIGKGIPVYISGALGQLPTIAVAGNTDSTKTHVVGLTAEIIANNATGLVAMRGELNGLDTSGGVENWVDGDELYLAAYDYTGSSLIAITNIIPTSGQIVHFAHVSYVHGTAGKAIIQTHRTQEICAPSGIDLLLRMGDNAGVNKVLFRDYANNEVGSIDSDGNLDLTGELRLDNNKPLYLDTANTKSLKWNPTNSRFEFNDNVFAATVFGVEAYFDEILYLGHSTTNAGEIDFWNGATAYDKILKYDDVNSRFDFNDSLKVNGYLLMTAELSCIGADFGNDEITGILNVDAVNGFFSGQLSITGSQKFDNDKKLIFGNANNVEMYWDSINSWGNIFATDFWILDSTTWNYYFGMSSSGIQARFNAGTGVGNWSESWLSKSNTFIDFYYGGGSSGGAAGYKRLGFYGTKDTAKAYRLKLWDEDNDTYFQLGRVSGIWESNADINLIDSVLKVAGTQVVGAQGATVADAVTQDLTGTDTIDKTKLEADLISCKTAINAIIDRIQAHGLIV